MAWLYCITVPTTHCLWDAGWAAAPIWDMSFVRQREKENNCGTSWSPQHCPSCMASCPKQVPWLCPMCVVGRVILLLRPCHACPLASMTCPEYPRTDSTSLGHHLEQFFALCENPLSLIIKVLLITTLTTLFFFS